MYIVYILMVETKMGVLSNSTQKRKRRQVLNQVRVVFQTLSSSHN